MAFRKFHLLEARRPAAAGGEKAAIAQAGRVLELTLAAIEGSTLLDAV